VSFSFRLKHPAPTPLPYWPTSAVAVRLSHLIAGFAPIAAKSTVVGWGRKRRRNQIPCRIQLRDRRPGQWSGRRRGDCNRDPIVAVARQALPSSCGYWGELLDLARGRQTMVRWQLGEGVDIQVPLSGMPRHYRVGFIVVHLAVRAGGEWPFAKEA